MVEKNAVDEAKDQVNTRAGAIKEHMSNPDWKDNKAENVKNDLTGNKADVKADRASESWKNTGINAYESAKETVADAAQSAKEWISGDKK